MALRRGLSKTDLKTVSILYDIIVNEIDCMNEVQLPWATSLTKHTNNHGSIHDMFEDHINEICNSQDISNEYLCLSKEGFDDITSQKHTQNVVCISILKVVPINKSIIKKVTRDVYTYHNMKLSWIHTKDSIRDEIYIIRPT